MHVLYSLSDTDVVKKMIQPRMRNLHLHVWRLWMMMMLPIGAKYTTCYDFSPGIWFCTVEGEYHLLSFALFLDHPEKACCQITFRNILSLSGSKNMVLHRD